MHTTQDWHNHAQFNMTQAMSSQKGANRQNSTSRAAHDETITDNLNSYNDVHSTMENKVKMSYRLREKLQERADSVENAIAQTRQNLAQLEAAYRSKDAPLQLCKWRMEQREKRPLREQVRDNVEVTLEAENATLIDTKHKLADAIKRTKNMITVLEEKLAELRHDIDQKTQALGIDEMCLRTTHRSYQVTVDQTPRSRSLAGSTRLPSAVKKSPQHQVQIHESTKNEVNRQQQAIRLAHSGANLEDSAKALREANAKLIMRCQKAADDALAKSERALQERINENQHMRRRLENEMRATQAEIDDTKRTIGETRSQMKSLEEPMENASTCNSWRKQRAHREHILDPVSTKLQEHQTMLLRAHEDLKDHHDTEKNHLQELNHRKERLKADLSDKSAALHIDLNCLTHEATHVNGKPINNLSKNKLTKAMKVDPMFVPMQAMHSGVPPYTAR